MVLLNGNWLRIIGKCHNLTFLASKYYNWTQKSLEKYEKCEKCNIDYRGMDLLLKFPLKIKPFLLMLKSINNINYMK